MASNNLSESLNPTVMTNKLTGSYDGAQGMVGEGIHPILNHRTMIGESVSDTFGSVGDTYGPSLNNGTGSLANLAGILTGKPATEFGLWPFQVPAEKFLNKQKLGASLSSR